jgi:hypothetical protein
MANQSAGMLRGSDSIVFDRTRQTVACSRRVRLRSLSAVRVASSVRMHDR